MGRRAGARDAVAGSSSSSWLPRGLSAVDSFRRDLGRRSVAFWSSSEAAASGKNRASRSRLEPARGRKVSESSDEHLVAGVRRRPGELVGAGSFEEKAFFSRRGRGAAAWMFLCWGQVGSITVPKGPFVEEQRQLVGCESHVSPDRCGRTEAAEAVGCVCVSCVCRLLLVLRLFLFSLGDAGGRRDGGGGGGGGGGRTSYLGR